MRVLYFHQHFSTPAGSAGTRSYEMAQRLLHHGHQVTMVCGSYGVGKTGLTGTFERGKRTGQVDGIDIIEFDLSYSNTDSFVKRSATFLKFALGGIRIAFGGRYDVLFATTTPLTAGIPGILSRPFRRKPFVFEVRDLWPELPKQMGVITNPVVLWLMSVLEWASYRSADHCIALSPGIANGIAERGVPVARIELVPNGCDLDLFGASDITPWRPDGVAPSDCLAIFTGTHGIANGLDAVLNGAARLAARGRTDIKLALVGDGKLKPKLQERAAKEGLNNVLFLDPVPKHQLAGLMAGADIGMQCLANVPAFYYGTSPNKFFDYISAGLPVLNNYPGWLADMITEHKCGFVVPPDDPAAFADALEQAADNLPQTADMGRQAAALARAKFNRADLGDKWVRVLERLVS